MRYLVLSLFALTLAACASPGPQLSASQCDANWAAVGYADALDGADFDKIQGYQAACAQSGAGLSQADIDRWARGWEDGVCAADGDCGPYEVAEAQPYDPSPPARYVDEPDYDYGGAYVVPRIGVAVGVGDGGVNGGVGVGFGYGVFDIGIGFGF